MSANGQIVDIEYSIDGGHTYKKIGTANLSTIEWDRCTPAPPKVRLYNVFCVAGGVELRRYLNLSPMTHSEASFFLSAYQLRNPGSQVFMEELRQANLTETGLD